MNTRKPPRLANWLLDRSGLARQNPPLAGDLLEEFRNGRSAAWFWRQTLIVILTSLAGNARLFRRLSIGVSVGWAAEVEITLVLQWFHFPHQFPGMYAGIIAISAYGLSPKALRSPPAKNAPSVTLPCGPLIRPLAACGLAALACGIYCYSALFQAATLFHAVKGVLLREP